MAQVGICVRRLEAVESFEAGAGSYGHGFLLSVIVRLCQDQVGHNLIGGAG